MPTGYTAIIEDNPETVTFRDYALRCARGMGACIMQRDEPLNEPPKAPDESEYHANELAKAKSRLAELLVWSDEKKLTEGTARNERAKADNAERKRKHEAKQSAYSRVRAQVESWAPPTPDHEGLKRFMLEQIDLCYRVNEEPYLESESLTPDAHFNELLKSAAWNVNYHSEQIEKESSLNSGRKNWIDALYASLDGNA